MATYNGHNEDTDGNLLLCIGNGMTAALETGSTASQNYDKGSYLFFNNILCKVQNAITIGDTLEIGTNLNETTIGYELSSHLKANNGTEFYFDYQNNTYGYNTSPNRGASTFFPFAASSSDRDFKMVIRAQVRLDMHWSDGSPADKTSYAYETITITRQNGNVSFRFSTSELLHEYGYTGANSHGAGGSVYIVGVTLQSFTWL